MDFKEVVKERSTYIIKPAPWDETIATRKQIPANEHVTMQIARQWQGEYGRPSLILRRGSLSLTPSVQQQSSRLHLLAGS